MDSHAEPQTIESEYAESRCDAGLYDHVLFTNEANRA